MNAYTVMNFYNGHIYGTYTNKKNAHRCAQIFRKRTVFSIVVMKNWRPIQLGEDLEKYSKWEKATIIREL